MFALRSSSLSPLLVSSICQSSSSSGLTAEKDRKHFQLLWRNFSIFFRDYKSDLRFAAPFRDVNFSPLYYRIQRGVEFDFG
jgi:hypothetical protein